MSFEYLLKSVYYNLTPALITTVVATLSYIIFRNWRYFNNKNVKCIRGLPIIGSLYKTFFVFKSYAKNLQELYNTYPDESIIGIFQLTEPSYLICDPDLVKRITVQDFDHFPHRKALLPETKQNSLLGRGIFLSRGQKWREMRNILSPAFTGNKMRMMFGLVQESSMEFVQGLKENSPEKIYELKDLYSRLTTNIIATCAFGLHVDTIKDRNSEFYITGKKITNLGGTQAIKLKLFEAAPKLMAMLSIQFIDKESVDYLREMVLSTIEYREKNNVHRPDMINLMMEARNDVLETEPPSSSSNSGDKQKRGNSIF